MSIEVTTIPKEPQWEDIVIDANKDFNWFRIAKVSISDVVFWENTRFYRPIDLKWNRIKNLSAPLEKNDALSMGNPNPSVVGNVAYSFNDTTRSRGFQTWGKVKETRIWRPGAYRIEFEMRNATVVNTVFGRIYRNGTPIGIEQQTSSTSWKKFTEDIGGWNAGDYVQVYARARHAGETVEIRHLRLFNHESDMTEEIM